MNARRWFLQRLGMGAAAAPMLPAMVAQQLGTGFPMSAAVAHLAEGGEPVSGSMRPWEAVGLSEKAWRWLKRDANERCDRQGRRSAALLGVIEADIACLRSLSASAQARMMARRLDDRHREQQSVAEKIWPPEELY